MKQLKRLMSFLLVLCLSFGMIPGALAVGSDSGNPFTDVASTDWFYSAVQYAYGKGIMSGTSANKFSPDVTTTRGMVVTMLHRMEGTPVAYGANFVDVGRSQYYTDAVAWASANGIVSGYSNGNFGADDVITREQMASVLYRYSEYRNLDTKSTAVLSGFSDADQVNSYAVNAMAWAVGNGLISGNGHNQLAPQASASRAEIASVLMRYDQTFAAEPEEQSNADASDTAAETFTVTFDLNYGSSGTYRTVKVQSGDTVKFPSDPSRTGYDFDGWYSDSSCKEKFDSKTPITGDITLYAAWDKSTSSSSGSSGSSGSSYGDGGMKGHDGYGGQGSSNHGAVIPILPGNTVSFNLNYSNPTETIPTQQVKDGGHAVPPSDPQRTGYAFLGWYYGDNFYTFAKETVTNPITLTAKWFDLSDTTTDTDKDGLTDYQEIVTFGMAYDPEKADTDGDGVLDADEDFDGDGLTNAEELNTHKTNPAEADSDHDGLTDYDEINTYHTDPMKYDSDDDGVSDGREVELKTDPMAKDTTFSVSNFGPTNGPKFTMSGLTAKQAESLTISEVHDELLFPDTLPGALSSAYDFSMDQSSTLAGATISFEFDPAQTTKDSVPVIYYFNETTQQLEELRTTVSGNIASATVEHFSKYILIDQTKFQSVQEWEDEFDLSDSQYESVQAVMVIDDSGSMTSNDRDYKRLDVAQDLIERLPKNSEVSVIQFASSDTNLTNGFTADKNSATQYLTRSYFRSSGSTYMYTAIDHAIDLFSGTVHSLSDDDEDIQLAEEDLDEEILTAEDDSAGVELLENRANAELSEDADEIITDDGEDADEGETADDSEDAEDGETADESETADDSEDTDEGEDADDSETADDSEDADDGEIYPTDDDLLDEDDDFFASLYEDTTPPTPRDSTDKVLKIVIVLSDGAAHDTNKHDSVINRAISQNVRIYTVGLGNSTWYFTQYLKPLAENTNGKFYLAADASQLADIYKDIGKVIDIQTDTDGDGIPDYYEDNLPLFNGTKLQMDKNSSDTDGDGIPDGDEVKLQFNYNEDKTKVWVVGKIISNPCDPNDPTPRYFERLSKDTTLGLTAEQKQTMATMGNTMLSEGFELPFIAGVLGNIYFEGTAGRFESSAYSDPSSKPLYLQKMETNYDYRSKYSGKNITEVSLQEVKAMVDALDSGNYADGEFGLGCIQWHAGRTKALVDIYVKVANGSDSITTEQVLEAEGIMIGNEMRGTHKYVYDSWKNSSVRDANTAGQIICKLYEVPANWQQKMYDHGNFAELIYSVMTDANTNP